MRRLYLYKKFTEDGKAVRDAAADIIRPDDDVFVVTEHDRKHEELDKTIEMGRAHDILFVEGIDDLGQTAEAPSNGFGPSWKRESASLLVI